MAFATLADYLDRTGADLSVAEADRVVQLLDDATALIQRLTGQTISAVSNDTVTWVETRGVVLKLPQEPVTAVDSVTVDGSLWASTAYMWTPSGFLRPTGYRARRWCGTVVVQYDHGYTTIPDELKALTIDIARGELSEVTASGAVTSEAIGTYRVTYDAGGTTSSGRQVLPDKAQVILDSYKPADALIQ